MAEDQDKLNSDASGAGTKAHKPSKAEQAKLPGGADFDVDNATDEEFAKHEKILQRRASVGSLTSTPLQAVSATTEPSAVTKATPAPLSDSDIIAVHPEHGRRGFSQITWDAMETNSEHAGWEIAVEKPADL